MADKTDHVARRECPLRREVLMKVTKDLTEGNIYKNYLFYALPLIFSNLLSTAYSTVDAMIAGKFIDEFALGAISATGSYDTIFIAFFNGFGAGFAIYVSHLFGRRDYSRIKRDIMQILVFLVGIILLVSGISIALKDIILDYLKVDPILRKDAEAYFIIYVSGYLFMFVNSLLVQALRALGITSFSLYMSLLAAILNVSGNLVAILVLNMGVAGVAMSTVLSSAIATVCYLLMLKRAFKELPSERQRFSFDLSALKHSFHYTLPTAIQQVAFHGINVLIAPAINSFGAAATTGNNVAGRIFNMCGLGFWNMTGAVGCYTAQCAGALKTEKIRKGMRVGFLMNVAVWIPFVLFAWVFAEPLASLFFPGGYRGEAFEYAVLFAKVFLPFSFINMIGHLIHSYLRGLGVINIVFFMTLFGTVVRYFATISLAPYMQMEGVFLAQVMGWIADSAFSVMVYFFFYFKKDRVSRLIYKEEKRYES